MLNFRLATTILECLKAASLEWNTKLLSVITLLHPERLKWYTSLAFLSAIGFNGRGQIMKGYSNLDCILDHGNVVRELKQRVSTSDSLHNSHFQGGADTDIC